jgi:FtsH-binding integral membrane protein
MDVQNVFAKVYMWMFIGLTVTFITGYVVSVNENMVYNIFANGWYYFFALAEFVTVIVMSARIRKMSYMGSVIGFLFYALLTGITLSIFLVAYEVESIVFVFGITALLFAVFAVIGYFTKIDLTKISSILLMALVGLLIATLISLVVNSSTFDLVLVIIGLLVFIIFIAFDIQRIKRWMYMIDDPNKLAIFGALELYLDFINIFIRLLGLFGHKKD